MAKGEESYEKDGAALQYHSACLAAVDLSSGVAGGAAGKSGGGYSGAFCSADSAQVS